MLEQGVDAAVAGGAREEVRMMGATDVRERELAGVDRGSADGVTGEKSRGCGKRTDVLFPDEKDPLGVVRVRLDEAQKREHIVHALREDRVIVTEGVGGRLARVFNISNKFCTSSWPSNNAALLVSNWLI